MSARKTMAKATHGHSDAVKKAAPATTRKATPKKATPKRTVAKKTTTAKATPKRTAPGKAAATKATTKKKAAKKNASKKAATKKAAAPKKVVAAPTPKKPKALKDRYKLEFYMNVSVASLYEHISTPSGLSKWFCDDVNVLQDRYTFDWSGEYEVAKLLAKKRDELVRFQWEEDAEEDPAAYFELRIRVDGMTNDTCLVVIDHSWPEDLEENKALWDAQVQELTRILGG